MNVVLADQDSKELIVSPILATICDGELDLRTKIDFPTNNQIVNLRVDKMDLARMRKELSLKEKNLSGKLSLEANLENKNYKNPKKIEGEGKAIIREGNIWEIDFLRGLGEFLFIPDFHSIIFEEGYAEFLIKKENIIRIMGIRRNKEPVRRMD